MKLKKTTWLVIIFVGFLIAAFATEKAYANDTGSLHVLSLGVGAGVIHYPHGITQKIGYTYSNKWVVDYERFGGKGYSSVHGFSVVRRVNFKSTGFGLSLGATYFD